MQLRVWSYWSQNGGNWRDLETNHTSMGLLKQLTDGLNHQFIPKRQPSYFDQHIAAIHFYPQLAFIIKGENRRDLPRYIVDEIERAGQVL